MCHVQLAPCFIHVGSITPQLGSTGLSCVCSIVWVQPPVQQATLSLPDTVSSLCSTGCDTSIPGLRCQQCCVSCTLLVVAFYLNTTLMHPCRRVWLPLQQPVYPKALLPCNDCIPYTHGISSALQSWQRLHVQHK
jgi:hypothetical protein